MPKPRALRPDEIRRSLVGRFEQKPGGQPGLADRLRQLYTKFGARSRRVILCWYRWTGADRGEGDCELVKEFELLPTPEVSDLSAVVRNAYSAGQLPVGSIRLNEVSAAIPEDVLLGRLVPGLGPLPEPYEFFYEVMEDGRSGVPSLRQRYRLFGQPARRETDICWSIYLERASQDRTRAGELKPGPMQLEDE